MNAKLMILSYLLIRTKQYELASRRFYNNEDTPTLLHLSRAEYALGMRERSYARMSRSIAYLRDARAVLAIRPGGPGSSDDRFARYNTAVIWQKALQMLFELPNEKRSLKDMQEAIEGLEEAQK